MAKIETTFIRPKEIFNVDDGTAKVVYDGYQNNPHEIELKENLEGDVKAEINAEFVPNDNNNVVFKDSENVEHELITNEGFPTAFAGEFNEAFLPALKTNQLISTTWQELKDLRDNRQLIAGSLYRITDYQCTTTQENTRSAGHQFDIVLLALSENKLAEEGWAMMHEDIYDVIFSDTTKKCYFYQEYEDNFNIVDITTLLGDQFLTFSDGQGNGVEVDFENKIVHLETELSTDYLLDENVPYNYFQNSNLSAWKVWYCLDNDTERFSWADANEPQIYQEGYDLWFIRDENKDAHNKFAWYNEGDDNLVFTDSTDPKIGDTLYSYNGDVIEEERPISSVKGFGRGVIYRLIDEFNNDVAYDFKNVQYNLKLEDNVYIDGSTGDYAWVYTFDALNLDTNERTDATLIDRTILIDDGYNLVSDNFVGKYNEFNDTSITLPRICFLVSWSVDDTRYFNLFSNVIKESKNCYFSSELNSLNCNGCYFGSNSRNITSSMAIYLNNKKVLTET